MRINVGYIHPEQRFKLAYGSSKTIWVNSVLDDSVDKEALHEGLWMTKNAQGKWQLATDNSNAYPVLEMEFQNDNKAVHSVTIARGTILAVTKVYDLEGKTPHQGMKLKARDGVLVPLADDGSDDKYSVVVIDEVHQDRLVVFRYPGGGSSGEPYHIDGGVLGTLPGDGLDGGTPGFVDPGGAVSGGAP